MLVQLFQSLFGLLVVVVINIEKAFDSVGRLALVRALKFYRCQPRLIDVIVDLYVGDRRGGEILGETEVTNGIRQGCTGSPQLFVMVVNVIID